jgi:hypothetical protein
MNKLIELDPETSLVLKDQLQTEGKHKFLRTLFVTPSQLKSINLFWIGIILYVIGHTLAVTLLVNAAPFQLIQLVGIGLFIYAFSQIAQFRFDNAYLQVMFVLLVLWTVGIVTRGLDLSYYRIKVMLFEPYEGALFYLIPFALFLPKNLLFYKKTFDTIIILGVFFFLHDLLVVGSILQRGTEEGKNFVEVLTKTLAVPAGFILLTYKYHPFRRTLLSAAVLGSAALLATFHARRSLMLLCLNPFIFSYLFYLINSKRQFFVIFYSLFIACFLALFAEAIVNDDKDGLLSYVLERGTSDTRTGVEECLYNDMEPIDWIIGKGINGSYYCPNIELDGVTDYRSGIESDYLNIILKGGIVHLALIILIALPAVFMGIFQSNNLLAKAAGVWVLFYLLYLYPSPVTKFNLNYLLVWICIGICYSKAIRHMSENMLVLYFRKEIN